MSRVSSGVGGTSPAQQGGRSSATVETCHDDVTLRITFDGRSTMYVQPREGKLGDALAEVLADMSLSSTEPSKAVTGVHLSDGAFRLAGSTSVGNAWRKAKSIVIETAACETAIPLSEYSPLDDDDEAIEEDGSDCFRGEALKGVYSRLSQGKERSNSAASEMRYVLVTGGVLSGIGKGMTASSIGVLMRSMGFRVTSIKIDPYLNVDAGTMSPFEHGEVFVLDDGGETDLDLGNYERFLDVTLTRDNNMTTGKLYSLVLARERKGEYLGKTVQVVPHLTNAISEWIDRVAHVPVDGSANAADVCIIELGGTVGDIESAPYIEALRQFQFKISPHCLARVHVSLVPCLGADKEEKTKPTQHSVRDLRAMGLHPDVIVCRSSQELSDSTRRKIGQFCHVSKGDVISAHDITNLYHLPGLLHSQGLHNTLTRLLKMPPRQTCNLTEFNHFAGQLDADYPVVKIALIGKYTNLKDAYLSVHKALLHAAMACNQKLSVVYVESSDLEADEGTPKHTEAWGLLKSCDGMLVPGGFGTRGVRGKIMALRYGRLNGIPTLGICLGMQLMVVEYCQNVLNWPEATSEEFEDDEISKEATRKDVIIFMPEISKSTMGGNMRLGTRPTFFKNRHESMVAKLYGNVSKVDERHRHRYEVNPEVVDQLEAQGLRFVGHDDTKTRMEIVEISEDVNRFYAGAQFHPEFKSRPGKPSPMFLGLMRAASGLAVY